MTVRRGDRLVWEHPGWPVPLYLTVVRVARDGTWCDIDVRMLTSQWSRRTPLPLPSRCRPDNSTGE